MHEEERKKKRENEDRINYALKTKPDKYKSVRYQGALERWVPMWRPRESCMVLRVHLLGTSAPGAKTGRRSSLIQRVWMLFKN